MADGLEVDGEVCEGRRGLTPAIDRVTMLVLQLAPTLIGRWVGVRIVLTSQQNWDARYGEGLMKFNLQKLGHRWFNDWHKELPRTLDLIVHEFAHHFESDHLSARYHEALSRMAGQLATLALEEPDTFAEEWRSKSGQPLRYY